MNSPILEVRGLTKTYPGVRAVDQASMALKRGEVHALVGENGAGKSTLIKILAGVIQPDSGEIQINGRQIQFQNGQDALAHGLSFIHQELNLISYMDPAENIFLGKPYPRKKTGLVDWETLKASTSEILGRLNIDVPMDRPVAYLTPGQQAMISIGRAFAGDAAIYIMDEPTASLTDQEIRSLFDIIQSLKSRGCTVVYVSHRLEEIFEIADRVTIMRDGKVITTQSVADLDRDQLIRHMIGRNLEDIYPPATCRPAQAMLEVRDLRTEGAQEVNFTLHKNEILGIAGLVGSGRSEILRTLFGTHPLLEGSIILNGKDYSPQSPADAIHKGFALVPEERRQEGLINSRPIYENTSLIHLDSFTSPLGFLQKTRELNACEKVSRAVNLRATGSKQPVAQLSGGNQQKVVFARWLLGEASVLMLDEPTRGVDVGARFEIYSIIRDLAANGSAILMVSSDLSELMGLCDRIIVMRRGKMAALYDVNTSLTQDRILSTFYGEDNEQQS